ncbi:hypothetical protein R80B4_02432 [Fibrobacteres bacterium R8-0-B4]
MWNDGSKDYDWRRNSTGGYMGDGGPASDAEQDIALLLIFADKLAERGGWTKGTRVSRARPIRSARRICLKPSRRQ